MQIDLTPEQQDFVRQAVASGRFERPEDAVQAAMMLWVEREQITQASMQALAEDVKRRGRAQLATEPQSAR
jgi:Arc/MetJ-type ribon-helix-helix transcriptional regulator